MTTAPAYLDVDDATFESAVIERSEQLPVVVDLWAPWCGPCRTLGPILEEAVAATDGKVLLTKVDVDQNPAISQAFSVQSIPAVYALRGRKVVGGFIGAKGAAEVRAFVESLLPTEAESEVAALVAAGDEASLRRALELDPDNEQVIVALADLLVDEGNAPEALEVLARIPESPDTRRVAARARTGGEGVDDVDAKLESLLGRVKEDESARQEFVDLLEILGPDDPRTAPYRRRLTAQLY
jgi:putative thioredoxin